MKHRIGMGKYKKGKLEEDLRRIKDRDREDDF